MPEGDTPDRRQRERLKRSFRPTDVTLLFVGESGSRSENSRLAGRQGFGLKPFYNLSIMSLIRCRSLSEEDFNFFERNVSEQ